MAGSRASASAPTFFSIIGHCRRLCSPLLAASLLAAVVLLLPGGGVARADHLMCGQKVEKHTQTVWIDPALERTGVTRSDVLAAFEPWNQLFLKYHGVPIFQEHRGASAGADILVTSHGSERTWVQTVCTTPSLRASASHSVVLLGWRDAWRNRQMLSHELGHGLGLADHGASAQHAHGHVGFKLCDYTYLGVMSYCTGSQAWFLDLALPGITVDGDMVRTYW